jgi:hypothetical protein
MDSEGSALHKFLTAALIAPSALGVHSLEGPLQERLAQGALILHSPSQHPT